MMKLLKFTIENFKMIRRLVITPIGSHTELNGKNRQGKSSALDAFEGLIRGAKGMQETVLREGATKGLLEADLGDIIIQRRLTKKNQRPGTLNVIAKDGGKWTQPRLDMLFGDFTFDPCAFVAMSPDDQVGVLRQLAGADYCAKLQKLELAETDAEETRKEGKQHLAMHGEPDRPVTERVEAVDSAALKYELDEAAKFNAEQASRGRAFEDCQDELSSASMVVEKLERELEAAQGREDKLNQRFINLRLAEPLKDTTAIDGQIENMSVINTQAHAWEDYDRRVSEQRELQADVDKYEEDVAKVREAKRKHAASAKLPVDGVTWGKKGVYVDGRPFAMQSSSQQLRMGMLLGLPLGSDLRIMLIRKGSELDDDTFKTVCELADEFDCHLLIEKVGAAHEGANSIEIVDGEAASDA